MINQSNFIIHVYFWKKIMIVIFKFPEFSKFTEDFHHWYLCLMIFSDPVIQVV